MEIAKGCIKGWLTQNLEEKFDYAERWGSKTRKTAKEMDSGVVREVLRVTDLFRKGGKGMDEGEGYEVVDDDDEVELQIKWRRAGDWRAGSLPLGRSKRRRYGAICPPPPPPPSRIQHGLSASHIQREGENCKDGSAPLRKTTKTVNGNGTSKTPSISTGANQKFAAVQNPTTTTTQAGNEISRAFSAVSPLHLITSKHYPTSQAHRQTGGMLKLRSTLVDSKGEPLRFETTENAYKPLAGDEHQGMSRASIHTCWKDFTGQLEEIKAIEEVLKERQRSNIVHISEWEGCGGDEHWIQMGGARHLSVGFLRL